MYKYLSSSTISEEQQHAPLLSSSPHNINYSSILDQQSIHCANSIDESCLHEQDNESVRRRQTRSSSFSSSSISHHQQKDSSSGGGSSSTTLSNNRPILTHSFWQSIFDQYSTSVYLENKGSVARDHLANERTYLAWLRTSLSTISVGIGITQLFRLERTMTHHPPKQHHNTSLLDGQMIGILFIFISMLFLIFACVRYFHAQVAMVHGFFPASRSTVALASCLLFFTMILMLISVSRQ